MRGSLIARAVPAFVPPDMGGGTTRYGWSSAVLVAGGRRGPFATVGTWALRGVGAQPRVRGRGRQSADVVVGGRRIALEHRAEVRGGDRRATGQEARQRVAAVRAAPRGHAVRGELCFVR